MRWAEISLVVPPVSVEPVSAVLSEVGCAGVVVLDPNAVSSDPFAEWIVQDQDQHPTPSTAGCTVKGYLPVDDRLERGLRLVLPVEHQRVPGPAPRAAIVDAPERHAVDGGAMPDEDGEQLAIRISLSRQLLRRRRLRGGLAATQLTSPGARHRHVELGDGDPQLLCLVVFNRPLDLFTIRHGKGEAIR